MLKEGKQLAIIATVTLDDGRGKMDGYTVCELQMICTKGDERGQQLSKKYFYRAELPDIMKKEFLQLGFCIKDPCDIPAMREKLIGKIALLSIVAVDGRLRCFITGYMGSDDPAKYSAENR